MGAGQHQTLKNRILLENYFLPGDLERQIERFVEHYNYERYHESLNNVTPADVYLERVQSILHRRERKDQEEINRTSPGSASTGSGPSRSAPGSTHFNG